MRSARSLKTLRLRLLSTSRITISARCTALSVAPRQWKRELRAANGRSKNWLNAVASNPKPDSEEFARKMLWHICGLRAEVRHIHLKLAELFAEETGEDVHAIQAAWKKTSNELHEKMYLDAVREVGLPPSKSKQGQGEAD